MKVPKLGAKTFEQCAGFLRIPGGKNILDNTAVHPEAYPAVVVLLQHYGLSEKDIAEGRLQELPEKINAEGYEKVSSITGVGIPTLKDIVNELMKPGRDIRDTLPPPMLRKDLMDLKDLIPGMELDGTVRNVIDFGAFVDIGVHQDGLVHLSEISDNFIKHPSEVLTVGDRLKVRVLAVDVDKKRISLSMKTPGERPVKPAENKGINRSVNRPASHQNQPKQQKKEEPKDLETMLQLLKNKYSH